jgi:hypothetical protein
LLVLVMAAQIWLGVLLIFDGGRGPLARFKNPAEASCARGTGGTGPRNAAGHFSAGNDHADYARAMKARALHFSTATNLRFNHAKNMLCVELEVLKENDGWDCAMLEA